MLASVPMRCMSIGVGSATSGSRCSRMPTWRWSRTACCAAATDFGRPSVIGNTRPGNSTVLRTGTMISASGGNGGSEPPPSADAVLARISASATARPRFLQRDHQAAVDDGAAHGAVVYGRKLQPAVKAALRQFEPMNHSRAQGGRIGTHAGDDKLALLDHGLGLLGVDAGQRDQDQDFVFGLQNIDRRLPGRLPRLDGAGSEQLTMHALGA